jgi:serine phosphatase RsbU (regulator of sigma subunit)
VRTNRQALIPAAVFAALAIGLLLSGGLYIRSLISASFQTATELRSTRPLADDALVYMLDEETGVRGFAATLDPIFLQPYAAAKRPFAATIAQLQASIAGLHDPVAAGAALDMAALNGTYVKTVAVPLVNGTADATTLEHAGKSLVDRFRSDVHTIDRDLTQREVVVNANVQNTIDRLGILVAGAVALVLLISVLYAFQQTTLASRVEHERVRAEEKQREADVISAKYDAEKRIADTLQEAFVQRPLPTHPTFRFSATYVPATEETKVGGDWYDAFELPGNRVLFAIGDVTGHGIEAAVTMNRVRQALISSALLDPAPAEVLQRVGRELYSANFPLVTAVVGYADANTFEFVYATAGHPPPVLMEPERAPRLLDCGSLPLGVMPETDYRTFRVQTVPGATLVLYTDGAVEHSRDVIEGEHLLLAAAAEAARANPADPATFIRNAVFRGREVGDDVAILTVGFAVDAARGVRVSAENDQMALTARIRNPRVDRNRFSG